MTTRILYSLLVIFFFSFTVAYGFSITSFPYSLDFDNTGEDYSDRADIGTFSRWVGSIDSSGYNNSPAYKVYFLPDQGDWESGVGVSRHDFPDIGGGMRPATIHIRVLVYYSRDYHTAQDPEEVKDVIILRCNADCSQTNASTSTRGISLHWENRGNDYPAVSENIGTQSTTQSGFVNFASPDYSEQWISFEYEFDLNEGVYRIFLDTQDGVYKSNNGTTPYSVRSPISGTTPAAWLSLSRLFGYMEGFQAHTTANGYDPYILLDEIVIDDSYIGPPDGFFAPVDGGTTITTPGGFVFQ